MNVFVLRTAIIYLIIYIYQKGTIYQNKRKDSKPTQYVNRYVLPQKSEGSSRNRAKWISMCNPHPPPPPSITTHYRGEFISALFIDKTSNSRGLDSKSSFDEQLLYSYFADTNRTYGWIKKPRMNDPVRVWIGPLLVEMLACMHIYYLFLVLVNVTFS